MASSQGNQNVIMKNYDELGLEEEKKVNSEMPQFAQANMD